MTLRFGGILGPVYKSIFTKTTFLCIEKNEVWGKKHNFAKSNKQSLSIMYLKEHACKNWTLSLKRKQKVLSIKGNESKIIVMPDSDIFQKFEISPSGVIL